VILRLLAGCMQFGDMASFEFGTTSPRSPHD
jgi:hypothetical protein